MQGGGGGRGSGDHPGDPALSASGAGAGAVDSGQPRSGDELFFVPDVEGVFCGASGRGGGRVAAAPEVFPVRLQSAGVHPRQRGEAFGFADDHGDGAAGGLERVPAFRVARGACASQAGDAVLGGRYVWRGAGEDDPEHQWDGCVAFQERVCEGQSDRAGILV